MLCHSGGPHPIREEGDIKMLTAQVKKPSVPFMAACFSSVKLVARPSPVCRARLKVVST